MQTHRNREDTFRHTARCLCAHQRALGRCPHLSVQDIKRAQQTQLSSAILAGAPARKDEPHAHTPTARAQSSKNEPRTSHERNTRRRAKASAETYLLQGLHAIAVEENRAVLLCDRHDAVANAALPPPSLQNASFVSVQTRSDTHPVLDAVDQPGVTEGLTLARVQFLLRSPVCRPLESAPVLLALLRESSRPGTGNNVPDKEKLPKKFRGYVESKPYPALGTFF